MARPRLGEEERRTRTVGVRVTEAEAAGAAGAGPGGAALHGSLPAPAGAGAAGADGGRAAAGGGGAAGAEPDRGESQSNGAGDELRERCRRRQRPRRRWSVWGSWWLSCWPGRGSDGGQDVLAGALVRWSGGLLPARSADAGGGPPSRERGAGGVDRDPQPGDRARESGRAGSWRPRRRRPRS